MVGNSCSTSGSARARFCFGTGQGSIAAEIRRWFSWDWYWDDAILDDERLVHIGDHITAAETVSA